MAVSILQKDEPVLRQKALPVGDDMFGTPKLRKILRDMSVALASQDDGVAIAAPQIGVSLRIFVISKRVLELLYPDRPETQGSKAKDMVFINPRITKLSRERAVVEEGCLSVRYLYGETLRAKKARVRAYDENGSEFEIGGSGLIAQIFQHEIDHLDGVLFIDHAQNVRDMPPSSDTTTHD